MGQLCSRGLCEAHRGDLVAGAVVSWSEPQEVGIKGDSWAKSELWK